MKRNPFIILLGAVVLIILTVIIFAVVQKEKVEESATPKNDRVEKVQNLLKNSSFENQLGSENWNLNIPASYIYGFDGLIKQSGNYSFSIQSGEANEIAFFHQRLRGIEADKKLSLLGFIKTEEVDSVFFIIEFYEEETLIASGYSPVVKGTTDWNEYNAWIKTYSNNREADFSAVVKGVLFGKGRAWFDNVRLYSIPINESIYNFKFDRILQ
jgi:hypothetical protein